MPGVPPDALAQVKKGLKGLFSRKKKDRYQRTDDTSGGPSASTSNAAPETTTADNEYQQVSTGPNSSIPQIAEPANVEQSKNIDLDPYASSTSAVGADASLHKDSMVKLNAKRAAEGMSATSGPLSDDLSGVYGSPVASPTENKEQVLPKWDGLRPVEKEGGVAEGGGGVHDVGATKEGGAMIHTQDKELSTESATVGESPAEASAMGDAVPEAPTD